MYEMFLSSKSFWNRRRNEAFTCERNTRSHIPELNVSKSSPEAGRQRRKGTLSIEREGVTEQEDAGQPQLQVWFECGLTGNSMLLDKPGASPISSHGQVQCMCSVSMPEGLVRE